MFDDPAELDRLDAIVHPLVAQRTHEVVCAVPVDTVVVHDIPLLVETGRDHYDLVVVVDAPDDVRVTAWWQTEAWQPATCVGAWPDRPAGRTGWRPPTSSSTTPATSRT